MNNELSQLQHEIDQLTPQELEFLRQSMDNPELLDALWAADYDEIPVSIEEFITNPDYLGSSFIDSEGKPLLYKYWIDRLSEIWDPNANIWELALSGAIGIGKSTIAVICMAYTLHRLLCLKDPAGYYRLTHGSHIAIAFFNLGLNQVYSVGYSKLQGYLQNSPWFLRHGKLYGRSDSKTYYPDKDLRIVCGSKMEHFIGLDIFSGFLDEMDYAQGSSSDDQSKMMKMYATIKRRMESRYMRQGSLPGMLILVSSKNSEDNFLEQYINDNKNKSYLKVVDDPLWVVKADQNLYSGKMFNLAVGNKYRPSRVLSDDESPESYMKHGQRIIQVPIEHKEAFEQSMNQALVDIAGIAISSHSKYLSYDKIKRMYRDYLKNPFTQEVIELGFDDDSSLLDYLDETKLSRLNRQRPHYVHWDASVSGDATGLAMTTVLPDKKVRRLIRGEMQDVTDLVHKITFGIHIRARAGEEIPFYKIRSFIYHLRDNLGFNIRMVSQDGFQSVDSLQNLRTHGFRTKTLSVDRSRAPYDALKNSINEERIVSPNIGVLEEELLDIEDDRMRNKIDHTAKGHKDLSDCIAACVFNATEDASSHQKAIETNELLDVMLDQTEEDVEMDIEQWR